MGSETTTHPIAALTHASTFAEVEAALHREAVALHLRHDTPEMDLFVARGEILRGEKARHGVAHLAALLAFDPFREDWLALVDEAEAKWGDLSPLLAPEAGEQRYFATEALRAYLQIGRGELDEAACLLADVARARPDVRYLDAWLLPILKGGGIDPLSDGALTRALVALVESCPEHAEVPVRRLAAMEAWADLAVELVHRATSPSPQLLMMAAGVCRRAGRMAAGLDLVERSPTSWASLTARALILRRAGRLDEAVATFARAGALDPADLSWMLEAGDALFDAERWSEAQRMYDGVLARQPAHPWAEPSSIACGIRAAGLRPGGPGASRLLELGRAGNHRARDLANHDAGWIDAIPEPSDALANALLRAAGERIVRSTLSDVEAPSNLLLHHALFGDPPLELTYTHVAAPDPREPVAPIAVALWRRAGAVLVPALPAPPPDVLATLTPLAEMRFRRAEWWARAGRIAQAFEAEDLEALLSCITQPPVAPPSIPAQAWIVRIQLASAMVIAQLEPEERWEDSARRRGLFSLLHGPMDWSTSAAIVALACLSNDEHAITTDVHRGFARLLMARPDSGAVCWEETLLTEWPWVRGLFPGEREVLRERLDALHRQA